MMRQRRVVTFLWSGYFGDLFPEMYSPFGSFHSPLKLSSSQKQSEYEREFLSPEMNENFSFPLGTEYSMRVETLTPGPVYHPGDSYNRRTPIDRPTHGAFEHSANLERKNELLQNSYLIEESRYSDFDFLCDDVEDTKLSDPIPPLQPFRFIQDQYRDSEFVSPGKNVHSQPFVPQNHYSTHENVGEFGASRFDLPERVPPLPRGSQYPARLAPDSHPQSHYPLQSLRHSSGLSLFLLLRLFSNFPR